MNKREKQDPQYEPRSHFTFLRSFRDAIDYISSEKEELDFYRGILSYAFDRKEPSFDTPSLKLAWTLIRPILEKGWTNYLNSLSSRGIPKPTMIGNQNAKKQSQIKAKSKPKQSQNKANPSKIKEEDKEEDIINPLNPPGGYESCDLSFIDDAFREVFYTWLDYKFQRKEKYKVQASLKQCYKNLLKLSDNDPETARLVVEQSIGNNYAGLFPLKQQNYGTAKVNIGNSKTESPTDQQLVADTFDLINEARAREENADSL